MKISKLICNIFHFIYCVFDIDMHIFLCIEVVVFEIKLQKKKRKKKNLFDSVYRNA